MKFKHILLFLFLGWASGLSGQTPVLDTLTVDSLSKGLIHYHLQTPKQTASPQNIHILRISKDELFTTLYPDMAWSDSTKYPTGHFALINQAKAAINGGFFNVLQGGSVSYLEYDGQPVAFRSFTVDPHAGDATNFSAALVCYQGDSLKIESIRHSTEYQDSPDEKWVMTAGPLLIQNRKKVELLTVSFADDRHPRTAVVETAANWLFITIDGRHDEAKGMNLIEMQDYFLSLGAINAMNLDGGGSTTMWIDKGDYKGVINCPSDNKRFDTAGERPVANAILIKYFASRKN